MNNVGLVIKCGGSTLTALPESFFRELKQLQDQGQVPVIVHGGGPAISQTLDRLGIESVFVNGLRKTDEAVLEVVEMVLCGQINKQIVRSLQVNGARAVGLSGIDGALIEAVPVKNAAEIGFVGEVSHVRAELIRGIAEMGYIPVIAPLGTDASGQTYNINADTAAGAVAASLGAERLIVVTDVPGILRKVDGERIVLPAVTPEEVEEMIESGEISGGMIPRLRAAIQCLEGGVGNVTIVNGSEPDVLTGIAAGRKIGTSIGLRRGN